MTRPISYYIIQQMEGECDQSAARAWNKIREARLKRVEIYFFAFLFSAFAPDREDRMRE